MKMLSSNLFQAFAIILKDKTILFLGCIPLLIGGTLYFFWGWRLYQLVSIQGRQWVESYMGGGTGANFAYGVLFTLFMAVLFFIANWTFVLVVSILSAPFNDIISSLVEKRHTNLKIKEDGFSLRGVIKNLPALVWREGKKTVFILGLTVMAATLSLFPPLAPVSLLVTGLLLSVQFIDYSWSRHQWSLGQCLGDMVRHAFSYTLSGGGFMLLMAIPLVNLPAITLAIVYFTLLWVQKNQNRLTKVEADQ